MCCLRLYIQQNVFFRVSAARKGNLVGEHRTRVYSCHAWEGKKAGNLVGEHRTRVYSCHAWEGKKATWGLPCFIGVKCARERGPACLRGRRRTYPKQWLMTFKVEIKLHEERGDTSVLAEWILFVLRAAEDGADRPAVTPSITSWLQLLMQYNHFVTSAANAVNVPYRNFEVPWDEGCEYRTIFFNQKVSSDRWASRAVKSNQFRFDSIFDREVAENIRFDSISIRFDTKKHQ